MNNSSDTGSNIEHEQPGRQDAEPPADAALLELGKVSDTRGGWLGVKPDVGAGFMHY
ncbi:MAG: hypothetical protein ACREVO_17355 [Steroidobacteraceae bacterium]